MYIRFSSDQTEWPLSTPAVHNNRPNLWTENGYFSIRNDLCIPSEYRINRFSNVINVVSSIVINMLSKDLKKKNIMQFILFSHLLN